MLKGFAMKLKHICEQINFEPINCEKDIAFFTKVRKESSFFLNNASNFEANEVKIFLKKNLKIIELLVLTTLKLGIFGKI